MLSAQPKLACEQIRRIDQRQPQSAGGCPNGNAGPAQPSASRRNAAREFGAGRFMSQCSVQVNSTARPCCTGCTNGTTSSHGSLAAWDRCPIGAHYSGDDASLRIITPPYTMGLIKGGSRSRALWISAFACCSACLACWVRPLISLPCLPAPPTLWTGACTSTSPGTVISRRQRADSQGGIAQWSVPQIVLGSAVGRT